MEDTTIVKRNWLGLAGYAVLAACLLTAAYLTGYTIRYSSNEDRTTRFALLNEAQQILVENYLGQLPSESQSEYGMIRGMLTALGDVHTTFSEPHHAELESDNLSGVFGGVGAKISKTNSGEFTLDPIRGQPAARAEIIAGDALLAVDGVTIFPEMSLRDVVARIRGSVGTEVILSVRTGDAPSREVVITRVEIKLPSTTWRRLKRDPSIGLVDIDRFSDRTADEVRKGLEALQAAGAARLVLDLRGNGGGSLQASVDVASLFLDGGVILHEVHRDNPEETYTASKETLGVEMPLVVLVDGGSASASEILAGALQDRGRAMLVGERTFGKGSVQLVFELSDGSSLHVTNARWYTPERSQLDGMGLKPDMEVASSVADGQHDPYLDEAVEYLDSLP